jgi:YD repeat-containing protein
LIDCGVNLVADDGDKSVEQQSEAKSLEQRAVTRQALVDLLKRGAAIRDNQALDCANQAISQPELTTAEATELADETRDQPDSSKEIVKAKESIEEKVDTSPMAEPTNSPVPATVVEYADGSLIEFDEAGQVVRVKDAKAEERSFVWDSAGRLVEVCLPFGRWKTVDGKTWSSNQGKTKVGIRKIDRDGTYWEEDDSWRKLYKLDGTQVEVHKPGGSVNLLFKNGSTLSQHKQNGTVRQIRNADGSECQYQVTADGRLRPLYHKYAEPTRLEFGTPEGAEVIDDISEVHYDWMEDESTLRMTYKSIAGKSYILERGRHGEFRSFNRQ